MIDGLFIHLLTQELNQEIAKSRLEKIVQQDQQSFVFFLYHQKERKHLVIDLSPEHFRMHLTKQMIKETTTSQYVMTLKKHLEGSILDHIEQYETDRVIILHFTTYDFIDGPTSKQLIFEAMGKHSNLILVKDGLIIDTFKKMFFETGRQLLPQATFEFFPSTKKNALTIDYEGIQSPSDLVNQYMGISPLLSKYLFELRCQWSNLMPHPTKSITQKRFYAFDLFDETDDKRYFESLSSLLDDDGKKEKPHYVSEQLFIERQLKKLTGKKNQLESSLEDTFEQLSDKNKGDLIYGSGLDMNIKISHLNTDEITLTLDPTKTLNDHAQDFYKSYQKAKRGIAYIKEQIEQTKTLIDHFESIKIFITMTTQDSIKDLEQELIVYGYKKAKKEPTKKKKDKPHVLTLKDGEITFTIGRNHLQNEYVTHTFAQKDDYWFHVKDAPGAHVVVNTAKLNETILRKACMLAAYFSGMRHSSSIPVDYTQVKYIKKIPGVPGYKVTYKNQQTLYVDIDDAKISDYLKNV